LLHYSVQPHSLAEDVKFSTHGRHPTAYLAISLSVYLNFNFFFCYFQCFVFQEQVCLCSSLGGMLCVRPTLDSFIHLPGKIFPCYTHIGDNV
jgi:hypothetical protein